jgi:hypothetical protein
MAGSMLMSRLSQETSFWAEKFEHVTGPNGHESNSLREDFMNGHRVIFGMLLRSGVDLFLDGAVQVPTVWNVTLCMVDGV